MRSCVIWVAAASLVLAATSASAEDIEGQLLEMQQRLQQLGQRLDATSDELAAANERVEEQQELIATSGLAEARGAGSNMASFLESVEMGGWVAASYLYNFSDLDGDNLRGGNTASSGSGLGAYPFHPDSNSFSLDQLWFEMEKPISEDSRGGFRADIAFGKIADILTDGSYDSRSGGNEDLELYQGYVQYLAPIGNGVAIKAGKFATTIGAEVAQQPYNFNITRGQVYNLLQPITHVGVMGSTESNGLSASLGFTNDTAINGPIDVENNNNKNILWHLGYAQDTWGASVNGLWGAWGGGNERDKETILDLILSFDPSENFSGYVNATWRQIENNVISGTTSPSVFECTGSAGCFDADAWGVAAAGRFALSDVTGLALRAEWVEDKDSRFTDFSGAVGGEDTEWITLTGTLDHMLTEKLMLRAEVRWDQVDVDAPGSGVENVFETDGSDEEDQIVGAVELLYNF